MGGGRLTTERSVHARTVAQRSTPVMAVIGVSTQAGIRRRFEDEFVAKLEAAGVDAEPSYRYIPGRRSAYHRGRQASPGRRRDRRSGTRRSCSRASSDQRFASKIASASRREPS